MRRHKNKRISFSVTAVFDPDGMGADFAYTVGLDDAGWCELHIWARPSDGTDPGLDFRLSSQDCASVLKRAADGLIGGALIPGSAFSVPFDGGACQGHFTIGEPEEPDTLDAFGVAAGALVLPLRWRLDRPADLRFPMPPV